MTDLAGTRWVGSMPAHLYHRDPCSVPSLSSTMAGIIVDKTLAHARMAHPKFGGAAGDSTRALTDGDMLHALLLTGIDSPRLALVDEVNPATGRAYSDFKTKRARELRDIAIENGQSPMLPHQLLEVRRMYANIQQSLCAKDLAFNVDEGDPEQVLIWEREADGHAIQCRTMIDWPELDYTHFGVDGQGKPIGCKIRELKTCETAKPAVLEGKIHQYGYDIQAAVQIEAVEHVHPQLKGRVDFEWTFVEKSAPWCVTAMVPTEAMLEVGRVKWEYACRQWASALAHDEWPDYTGNDGPVFAFPRSGAMELCERLRDAMKGEGAND